VVSTATRILHSRGSFQSSSHISLLCVYRIDLAPTTTVNSAFTSSTKRRSFA